MTDKPLSFAMASALQAVARMKDGIIVPRLEWLDLVEDIERFSFPHQDEMKPIKKSKKC